MQDDYPQSRCPYRITPIMTGHPGPAAIGARSYVGLLNDILAAYMAGSRRRTRPARALMLDLRPKGRQHGDDRTPNGPIQGHRNSRSRQEEPGQHADDYGCDECQLQHKGSLEHDGSGLA